MICSFFFVNLIYEWLLWIIEDFVVQIIGNISHHKLIEGLQVILLRSLACKKKLIMFFFQSDQKLIAVNHLFSYFICLHRSLLLLFIIFFASPAHAVVIILEIQIFISKKEVAKKKIEKEEKIFVLGLLFVDTEREKAYTCKALQMIYVVWQQWKYVSYVHIRFVHVHKEQSQIYALISCSCKFFFY